MHTLKARLVLSHLLPVLLITPLMGIALVYVLETQVLLSSISSDLTTQAVLLAQMTTQEPVVWSEHAQAEYFVQHLGSLLSARIMLLTSDGQILASSDPADEAHLGQVVPIYGLDAVQSGAVSVHTAYSQSLRTDVADVFVPVIGPDRQVSGIVRLTHQLTSVYERFLKLRYLIIAILAAGLALGAAAGWLLAANLERPLQRVTQAVQQLSQGDRLADLPEQGPDEIRILAVAFNDLVARLRSLEQSRKQLLANLVHELGRPLGGLRSAIQALQRGADRDPALRDELLAGMDEEAGRLQRLLDDLAHLHDQLLGPLELNRTPAPLGEWLGLVSGPWREEALARRLHWQADLPAGLPVVSFDPDRLAQALGNLVSNAIRYTPPGGSVTLAAGVEPQAPAAAGEETAPRPMAWIRVTDSGPGIPFDEQAKVFTPFYRGKQGRRFPQGMGLGLNIARDLAAAHQGRLEMESTPGLGSRFTIWLPVE